MNVYFSPSHPLLWEFLRLQLWFQRIERGSITDRVATSASKSNHPIFFDLTANVVLWFVIMCLFIFLVFVWLWVIFFCKYLPMMRLHRKRIRLSFVICYYVFVCFHCVCLVVGDFFVSTCLWGYIVNEFISGSVNNCTHVQLSNHLEQSHTH